MTLVRLLLLVTLSACAPVEQGVEPKDPKDVQLVKTVPSSTCKELRDLVGEAPNGPDADSKAKKNLREKAAQMGANYVRWDALQISEDPPRTTITGTAYLCPAARPGGAAPAPSS
jgi:hypothetical protein